MASVMGFREVLPRTFSHRYGESPSAERKYVLTVDEPIPTQLAISSVGILHGDPHPEFSYLRMLDASVSESDRYHVEISYKYELPKQKDFDPNPLARPDSWTFSVGGAAVPAMGHYYGDGNDDYRPLVNAAGDYLEGVEAVEAEVKATITGNRAAFPLGLAADVVNCLNSAPYLGAPAFSWMCSGISAQAQTEVVNQQELRYWSVSVELIYRKSGWVLQIPHVGTHYVSGGKKKRCWVYNEEDEKVASDTPQPLSETGDLLHPGGGGDPEMLTRRVHPVANFDSFFGTPPA